MKFQKKRPSSKELRRANRRVLLRNIRLGIKFHIGKHLKPKETVISTKHGYDNVSVCPRCGDLVYCKTQCVMCGQRFKGSVITVGEVMANASYD